MTNTTLKLQQKEDNGVHVVHLEGPLDSVTYDEFRDFLEPLINKAHPKIVLDCSGLTYINSRGLTLLARYQRILSSSLAFFGVASLNARIFKAISLLGLEQLLKIYPTVEEAAQAATAILGE
ncbi:MAG: STAS domain-containing protein [Lentisphaerae bacterium]|jgi:anti-sigma B factor antagonist|nr:STAS domain-containing protein [Lentisphaerota bacterium]